MKIYVASSWRNGIQHQVVAALREEGHDVYDFRNPAPGNHGFRWSAIDVYWPKWTPKEYREALLHPVAIKGFDLDFSAMKWADTCILVLPCGRSAHIEAGWMAGAGKKVYVLMLEKDEPELMYKCCTDICITMDELLTQLRGDEHARMAEMANMPEKDLELENLHQVFVGNGPMH